jgi:hypothetical protein
MGRLADETDLGESDNFPPTFRAAAGAKKRGA